MSSKKDKKPHLGRGLEALLGSSSNAFLDKEEVEKIEKLEFPSDQTIKSGSSEISVNDIVPNPYQPRTTWIEEDLKDLSASIKSNGVIQPIITRKKGSKYEIVAGERRFRASKMAGLETVPTIVRKATDEEMLELALVENIHRSDLNPIERAKAYHNYLDTFNINQTEAAKKLGEDRSVISNYIRLLDLPHEIQQMLIDKKITMGHARALLSLPTDEIRRKLANKAMAGRLSVREVERQVRLLLDKNKKGLEKPEKPAHIVDLEKKLRDTLGTKVTINAVKSGKKGKIIIEFYSLDEFDRLSERIGLEIGKTD